MSYAHVLNIEQAARPLELELLELHAEYVERERADLSRCRRLAVNWQRWKRERNLSKNDYLKKACPDFDEKVGTYFRHLFVGAALNADFEGNMRQLEPLGWALLTGGHTAGDLRTAVQANGIEATARALRQERGNNAKEGTTLRRMPESAAESMDTLAKRFDAHPDAPVVETERRGLLVKMLEALPEPAFEALAQMAQTGENTMAGLAAAVRVLPYREWLKRQPCTVTGETLNVELHHWRLGEQTARHVDLYLPVVARLHRAEVGHKHDSVHGSNARDWSTRHFGSPEGAAVRAVQLWWEYLAVIDAV